MTEHDFKTKYIASENSLPVNEELKARLIEAAKKAEAQPAVTVSDTARKRRRRIITELSALAACAALCAYAIPKTGDRYVGFTDVPTESTAAPTEESAAPTATEPPAEEHGAERHTAEQTGSGRHTPGQAGSGQSNVEQSKTDRVKPKESKPTKTAPTQSAPQAAAAAPEPAAAETAADTTTAADTAAVTDAPSNPGVTTDTGVSTKEAEEHTAADTEISELLAKISADIEKLNKWDSAIARYKTADGTISGYYDSFARDKELYLNAAAEFEKSYADTDESAAAAEARDKYETELNGIYFESCRESYRKAMNYIEITILTDDTTTDATAESEANSE